MQKSRKPKLIRPALLVALAFTLAPLQAQAQVAEAPPHSPKSALYKSAIVPGWGQVYNGQRLKVPIIYTGLVGLGGFAVYLNSRHSLYDRAYLFKVFEGQEDGVSYPDFETDYEEIAQGRSISAETLRLQRNAHRRNRDLTILGIAAVYSLNLLDAYVNAHLVDFDVSDDISFHPNLDSNGARLSLRFNL